MDMKGMSDRLKVIEWLMDSGRTEEECAIIMGAPDFVIELLIGHLMFLGVFMEEYPDEFREVVGILSGVDCPDRNSKDEPIKRE